MLDLTGQLGTVMQESAKASYSYVRANAKKYGIVYTVFTVVDYNISRMGKKLRSERI